MIRELLIPKPTTVKGVNLFRIEIVRVISPQLIQRNSHISCTAKLARCGRPTGPGGEVIVEV